MKKQLQFKNFLQTLLLLAFLGLGQVGFGQVWNYDFGTGTGTFSSTTASTTFLPTPTAGTARVRMGTNPGTTILANPGVALGSNSEMQFTSNTGSTSTSKMSIYDYTASKIGYAKFKIAFNGGTNGIYYFTMGDGTTFSDSNAIAVTQIFAGIQFNFGASNQITYNVISAGAYISTGITNPTTLFSQSTSNEYLVEVYMNNNLTSTTYQKGGSNSLANATWDLWVNGVKVGVNLSKGNLPANANIDSFAFNHQSSATSPGTLYIDDIEYSNALPSAPTYALTYNGNTNTGGTAPATVNYAEAASVTVANAGTLVKTGFTFSGWNTAADGTGTPYAAGSTLIMPANAVTLYAQWTAATTPVLAISGTLAHGSVCPTFPATSITYTITNNGGATADGITVSSDNPEFVVSGLSSTSIAANGTATYVVTFTPASAGAKTATITVSSTTSGSNSPTNALTGTGTATVAGAVTSSAATGVTAKTATLNGNVTNIGTCPTIIEKGFVYAETSVNATPTDSGIGVTKQSVAGIATGAYTLSLTNLPSSTQYSFRSYVFDGSSYVFGAVLTFTTSPALVLTGTLAHGSVCPTLSTAPITYTITNNGATTVNDIAVGSSNGEFVVSGLSATSIAPSATATYQVTFTPLTSGAKTATITVTSSNAVSATNALTGTGTAVVAQAVSTNTATTITINSANLRANGVTFGVCPATTGKGFIYSETSLNNDPLIGGSSVTNVPLTLGAAGNFTQTVTALGTGINYTYKAYLFNGTTYTYGASQTFTTLAPPVNDNCTLATNIVVNAAAITGDLANATQSLPAILCTGTGNADDDVWFKFTTGDAGSYTIAANGGLNLDLVLDIRSGACDGTNFACVDNTIDLTETITLSLLGNTTYYVRLYDYDAITSLTTTTFTIAVTSVPELSNNGTSSLTFANQNVQTNSGSQIINLSGSLLNGAPGNILATASSSDFQVSIDNTTWNSTVSVPYTSATLTSTSVYVRFTPQTTGVKTGDITFSGGGATSIVVALSGTGIFEAPVATAASNILQNSFQANWNSVVGATGYQLDVATSADFTATTFTDLASWNFPSNPDNATADSGISANTAKTISTVGGTGTISYTTLTSPNSVTSVATANGWNNGNNTKYWMVDFSTVGYYNNRLSSVQRSSGSGPRDFKVQYRIGASGTWFDVAGASVTVANDYSTGVLNNIVLPTACDNQTSVFLRWIMTSNNQVSTGTVAGGGTSAIDNINIEGNLGLYVSGYANLNVGNVLNQNVTGLTPNTQYYYRVRSFDANSTSSNSNVISVRTDGPFLWTGTTNNLWSVATNWFGGITPDGTKDVIINSGTPILDVNYTVPTLTSLTLNGGTLTVNPTNVLTVAGTAAFNNNNVILKSDATGTAAIGQITGTLSGATNVTVERYIAGRRAFRFLTPGVTTTTSIFENWQNNGVATAGIGTHITGGATGGFDVTETNNPSLHTYDAQATGTTTGFTAALNTNATVLKAGVGYRLLVRGDRFVDLTAASTENVNVPTTLSAKGTLKVGQVVFSADGVTFPDSPVLINNQPDNTQTNGYTLIGNPYASPVDWHAVAKTGVKNNAYYTWDPTLGTTAQRGRYVVYAVDGNGVGSTNLFDDNSPLAQTNRQFLQSGQAVFIKNDDLAVPATLTFEESDKATTTSYVFRSATEGLTTTSNSKLFLSIYEPNVLALGGAPIDGALALFGSNYNNSLDTNDVDKLTASGENVAFVRENKNLAIETLAPVQLNDELYVKTISFQANKNYTFKVNTQDFDTTVNAKMVDLYLNTETAIDVTQPSFVTFNTTTDAASYGANRFKIVFNSASLANESFNKTSVSVFPNPIVNNQFTIALPSSVSGLVTVSMSNMLGQEVFRTSANATTTMNIQPKQQLEEGIYVVSISNAGQVVQAKVVVKK